MLYVLFVVRKKTTRNKKTKSLVTRRKLLLVNIKHGGRDVEPRKYRKS